VIASTLEAILNLSGFHATAFTDPMSAMAAIQSSAPDMLIIDVELPGMNGIELAIRVKSICPTCKLLLFSGQATTSGLLDKALEQGHEFPILAKPVQPDYLLAAIRSL
jgi:DNA-binding NtrC family response regulator